MRKEYRLVCGKIKFDNFEILSLYLFLLGWQHTYFPVMSRNEFSLSDSYNMV